MKRKLENKFISLELDENGAQLTSIKNKNNQLEYLWQGNDNFWKRQAPNLFPIVGKLKDNEFEYENNKYSMGQHGFARDSKFEINEIDDNKIIFELDSNADTKLIYPFDFKLLIKYELINNEIDVNYKVKNLGSNKMYFSIGAHPGFNVPIENENFDDYEIKFSSKNNLNRILLKDGLSELNQPVKFDDKDSLKVKRSLFKDDAFILDSGINQDYEISLTNSKNSHGIILHSYNHRYLGIWSMYPKESPFVCIEPWWGIADNVDSNKQLTEKVGINILDKNELFESNFKIEIL
ncbi:aldose 1-epimerase family protein [Lactobacillus sp. S2-2]|uniref:aldose 1-epimerase family protein n=1 Tax=Lactobacillus sp. S2-2 TaxID=2692917 RepID=UPI001F2698DD|nr:aldose 1-epimerase family protein [Lactobacillus sp. S2-2]